MKLSVTMKLLLALVTVALLVLLAALGLSRWNFQNSFAQYIGTLEAGRLEALSERLVSHYQASNQSWEALTPQRFRQLLRTVSVPEGPPPRGKPQRRDGPPTGRPPHADNRGGRGSRPPPPRGGAPGPPTALFDLNGVQLAGAPESALVGEVVRQRIVLDGMEIAELRSFSRTRYMTREEQTFLQRQQSASWMIGALALLLATGLSLLLARGLLSPVRRMAGEVAKLSAGDYAVRMETQRSDELGVLMNDLDHLAETLEQGQLARRRWLADISHELRTPITVLRGEIEALKDGLRPFDPQALTSFDQEVSRIGLLIDDLYDLSVSDVGGFSYRFANFNLSDCVARIGARAARQVEGIAVSCEVTGALQIVADGDRIEQLLNNLVDNALSYTDSPGSIVLSLTSDAKTVTITVADTAPGVPAEDCPRLFEPLFRLDASRSRRSGGAGLGLAIARNIVDAHSGTIHATPAASGGLCVCVVLPLHA